MYANPWTDNLAHQIHGAHLWYHRGCTPGRCPAATLSCRSGSPARVHHSHHRRLQSDRARALAMPLLPLHPL